MSNRDEHFMQAALELAARGRGLVEPNPMVGCVIVRSGEIVGSGFHKKFGGPHAEIEAIRSCQNQSDIQGATAYVTLEPCCHHGKTPPCTDALIGAGVNRVVVAMQDPFPQVDGGGLAQLRDAGIETTVGVLQAEAQSLNAPYLKLVRTGTPWVIAKWAMTLDGRIATTTGQSQWITGEASRAQVHRLRSRVDAVAVGMGTVEADDPTLTARPPKQNLTPEKDRTACRVAARVIFCRHRQPRPDSNLIRSASDDAPVILMAGPPLCQHDWGESRSGGVEVVNVQSNSTEAMIGEALTELGKRKMSNVMVEGGAELLASFFAAGQLDECHIYLGAKLLGGKDSPGPIGGRGIAQITEAPSFQLVSLDRFDDDIRAVYRKSKL